MKTNQNYWDILHHSIMMNMESTIAAAYVRMLEALEKDHVTEEGDVLLGFRRAPAAKGNHHAEEGGLVKHLVEMFRVWVHFRKGLIPDEVEQSGHLTTERVLRAILNHDLHKAWRTFKLISADPWQTEYARDQSEVLMTWDAKTFHLLAVHQIPMDEEQWNALLWSEGGWAPHPPKYSSVLAKVAYLLDEMSGNVINRIETGTLMNVRVAQKSGKELVPLKTARSE